MLFSSRFSVYRCDRNSSNSEKTLGGGVLIAVRDRFTSTEHVVAENNEALCVKLSTATGSLFLCCGYIAPTSSVNRYRSFCRFIDSVAESAGPDDEIVVVGDLNLPNLNWNQIHFESNNSFFLPHRVVSQSEIAIVDGLLAVGLMQICNLPNNNNCFLDLVFTSDTNICQVNLTEPIIKNEVHHSAMLLTIETNELERCETGVIKKYLNLDAIDLEGARAELGNVVWQNIFITDAMFHVGADEFRRKAVLMFEYIRSVGAFDVANLNVANVDNSVEYNSLLLYYVVFDIFSRHTVMVNGRKQSRHKYPEWFSSDVINLMKIKRAALKQMRRTKLEEDVVHYREVLRMFKAAHREAYQVFIADTQNNLKCNPKSFWRFVNGRRKNSTIPEKVKYKDIVASNAQSSVNLFADHFKCVFDEQASISDTPFQNVDVGVYRISRASVANGIRNLDEKLSSGPDTISNKLLKRFEHEMLEPLTRLFNESLASGHFPLIWKVSHITPIHKKGSRTDVENYRGIAIQSAIPKLFEKLVYSQLYDTVANRISSTQHGFLKKRSVMTNLCEFSAVVTDYIAKGFQVDCIYTDMSKAFDAVKTDSVLRAISDFGFSGAIFNWLKTYLSARIQFVKMKGNVSEPFNVHSGVPQGSHLGPLLFVLVMNRLPDVLSNAIILIYADDIKIFLPIRTIADCIRLQSDMEVFGEFCFESGLIVNAGKCSVVSYSRKVSPIRFPYVYNDTAIPRNEIVRDLGVIFDSSLSFMAHIDNVIKDSLQLFALVRRYGRDFDDPYAILAIYIGLVRSKLDFASVIWRPQYVVHIQRLESIQKKIVRFALRNLRRNGDELPSYHELCRLVDIDTVHCRHKIADVVFFTNVLSGRIDSPALAAKLYFNNSPVTLRNRRVFNPPNRNRNYSQHEPTCRFMRDFNALQHIIDVNMSPAMIKNRLSLHFRGQLH